MAAPTVGDEATTYLIGHNLTQEVLDDLTPATHHFSSAISGGHLRLRSLELFMGLDCADARACYAGALRAFADDINRWANVVEDGGQG